MATVLGCWRYPVKSAAAEAVEALTVTANGVRGDRVWAVLDADGAAVSAKHPARGGRLLEVSAGYDEATGTVVVRLPDGASYPAGASAADAALSGWLGRPVRLTDVVPPGLRLLRRWPGEPGMLPDWVAESAAGADAVTEVAGARHGRFVDYGPVHVVTTGALALLSERHGGGVEALRFRPNLLLDLPADPEPGQVLTVGDVTLAVDVPTPRCIVPSLAQPGAAGGDPDLLRVLARHYRRAVGHRGRAAVFGCYATVSRPGRVGVGDALRVLS